MCPSKLIPEPLTAHIHLVTRLTTYSKPSLTQGLAFLCLFLCPSFVYTVGVYNIWCNLYLYK